jgi:glycosyltransferase involved in cell wall biosynthesis
VVEDGTTGFLVPPGNAQALGEAMERLERLPPDSRARLGACGRALVERRYGVDSVMEMWERLYSRFEPSAPTASPGQR